MKKKVSACLDQTFFVNKKQKESQIKKRNWAWFSCRHTLIYVCDVCVCVCISLCLHVLHITTTNIVCSWIHTACRKLNRRAGERGGRGWSEYSLHRRPLTHMHKQRASNEPLAHYFTWILEARRKCNICNRKIINESIKLVQEVGIHAANVFNLLRP